MCILDAPRWGNSHIEGINLVQTDFITEQPKKREKVLFFSFLTFGLTQGKWLLQSDYIYCIHLSMNEKFSYSRLHWHWYMWKWWRIVLSTFLSTTRIYLSINIMFKLGKLLYIIVNIHWIEIKLIIWVWCSSQEFVKTYS